MKTIYFTQEDYSKLKPYKTFPNPLIKLVKMGNEVVKAEVATKISIRHVNDKDELMWHNLREGSKILTSTAHFPTSLLMGVDKSGKFYDEHQIGAQIGGNLGTKSLAVIDLEKALKILTDNNFTINE